MDHHISCSDADYVPCELADPKLCFAGVGVGNDVERLRDDCKLVLANALDLPPVAADMLGRQELRQAGLKKLASEVMGVEVDKRKAVTCSKWHLQTLSEEQVRYACIDAFVSFDVARRLLSGDG